MPSSRPPAGRKQHPPARGRARAAQTPAWPTWSEGDGFSQAILPLRVFLGLVFCYAGISKVADRRFLDSSSFLSMHAQLVAVKRASPIGGLLGPVVSHTTAFGILMAAAELAVGLGVLLGLLTRIAAAGGMFLALSLWLTISWQATPWYTSADVVYLVAMTPLLLGGAGVWSVDGWLAATAQRHPDPAAARSRRVFVVSGAALVGAAVLGTATLFRRSAPASPTALPPTTTGSTPPTGTPTSTGSGATSSSTGAPPANGLVAAADVPVGGGKQVFPNNGLPVWVLQLQAGQFTAVDGTCPHQGCPVSFVSPSQGFVCPCHGSTFQSDGTLVNGPATSGLPQTRVKVVGGEVVPG